MLKKAIGFSLAGYAKQAVFDRKLLCLFREHKLTQKHLALYVDDWDEEADASGWRAAR